ncbi:MAG TPA: carboxypeptidase-like regulatory domain-containing protein, partial [Bryobacteraceae bacterium]
MLVSRFYYRLSLALCLLAALCLPLAAQTSFGRISGTVTDPTGAAVAGAQVTITDVDTQAKRDVITDNNGFYVATNL